MSFTTAFDRSPFGAFVSSPFGARNRASLDTDAIKRFHDAGGFGFEPMEDYVTGPIFPAQLPIDGRPKTVVDASFGNFNRSIDYPAGWFRMRLLVWGIAPICNPWVEPESQIVTTGVQNLPLRIYKANYEVYLAWDKFEPVPDYPASGLSPRRIPLNAIDPTDEETIILPFELFHMRRLIEVSGFSGAPGTLGWMTMGGGISSLRNFAYHATTGVQDFQVSFRRLNRDSLNPNNPITFNGQTLPLFYQRVPTWAAGMCAVPLSIAPDSQYRLPRYVDSLLEAI